MSQASSAQKAAKPGGRVRLSSSLDDEGRNRVRLFNPRVISGIIGYLASYKLHSALIMVSVLISSLTSAAGPWLVGMAIDRFIKAQDLAGLNLIVGAFIGVGAVSGGARFLEITATTYLSQGVLLRMRLDLFRHLERLSLSFYDANEVGRIMSRVQNDVEQLEELFDGGLFSVVSDILTLGGIVVALLLMNVRLALVTMSVVPLLVITVTFWHIWATAASMRVRQAMAVVNGALQENISGVRVIQSLCRENSNLERFAGVNGVHLRASLHAGRLWAAVMPIVELLVAAATALIIGYGGNLVLKMQLEVGAMVAFALYVQRFFEPIRDLIMQYTLFQRSTASLTRIFEVLAIEPEPQDAPDAISLTRMKGDIRFEHVSFSYLENTEVLHDINLHIRPGEMVALVGPTGAGKSTIASLIARFYESVKGAIYLDGHDIRRLTRGSLARGIGIVLQDAFLFSGTIADNIRYGRLEATDAEVIEAARAVGAHDFIARLEHGYETQVHERGSNLSAGQRQLVSLARVLLADARILILDEATANIDTRTEAVLQQALRRLFAGRTSLVIAHRLSTVRDAHRIIVMDGGRIVEEGTHEELLQKGGLYTGLYTMPYTGLT
ncbi:MAG: ABC transporter ATP-binding protein [Chloroflexota bacterium]